MAAPEAHHQILCAVIKHKRPEYQIVSQPTLHNILLSTMNRILSVVRSTADKSIELSRGVVRARGYGNSKTLSGAETEQEREYTQCAGVCWRRSPSQKRCLTVVNAAQGEHGSRRCGSRDVRDRD